MISEFVISSAKTFVSSETNEPPPETLAAAPVLWAAAAPAAAGGADGFGVAALVDVEAVPENIDWSNEAMCVALLFWSG